MSFEPDILARSETDESTMEIERDDSVATEAPLSKNAQKRRDKKAAREARKSQSRGGAPISYADVIRTRMPAEPTSEQITAMAEDEAIRRVADLHGPAGDLNEANEYYRRVSEAVKEVFDRHGRSLPKIRFIVGEEDKPLKLYLETDAEAVISSNIPAPTQRIENADWQIMFELPPMKELRDFQSRYWQLIFGENRVSIRLRRFIPYDPANPRAAELADAALFAARTPIRTEMLHLYNLEAAFPDKRPSVVIVWAHATADTRDKFTERTFEFGRNLRDKEIHCTILGDANSNEDHREDMTVIDYSVYSDEVRDL